MYIPKHFEETRPERLHALVQAHPFGLLVTQDAEGLLSANPMPFLLEHDEAGQPVLRAHVARANPVWRELADGDEVLVMFRAAHAYISPSWYPSKHEHGKAVPTWNYVVVTAHGRPRFIDERDWLRGQLTQLVDDHEAQQALPWKIDDAPPDFVEKMLAAIVGVEIPIERIAGKWKTSQNRPEGDRIGVAEGLAAEGQAAMAEWVARR